MADAAIRTPTHTCGDGDGRVNSIFNQSCRGAKAPKAPVRQCDEGTATRTSLKAVFAGADDRPVNASVSEVRSEGGSVPLTAVSTEKNGTGCRERRAANVGSNTAYFNKPKAADTKRRHVGAHFWRWCGVCGCECVKVT